MSTESKSVLMLGTNVSSIDAVKYLQSKSHVVTVTDFLADDAGAKAVADATARVSTRDTPALTEFVRDNGFDAIVTGINEGNIRSALAVSEALGLPFYCTSQQWDSVMNKDTFRDLCHQYGVPAPGTYFTGPGAEFRVEDQTEFPVIVKPVDGSSLSGITICNDAASLQSAINSATDASIRGDIVVEEFVQGKEFTAAYVVVNGVAALSSIDDRVPLSLPGATATLPALRIYPSAYLDEYVSTCDKPVRNLIAGIGLENACIYVQGIRSSDKIIIFEAGLRLAGEAPYRFIEEVNGVNQLHHLVDSSIGAKITHDVSKEDAALGGTLCAIASLVLTPGTVHTIRGLEETLAKLSGLLDHEVRYQPGETVPGDGTLRQIGIRFILRSNSRQELEIALRQIETGVEVLDNEGSSMIAEFDFCNALKALT